MTKRENENNYPFAWVDEVIEVTLNPSLNNRQEITPSQLKEISTRFTEETRRIFSSLKAQTFCLLCSDKTRAAVEQYDTAIIELGKQAKFNLETGPQTEPWLKTGQLILAELEVLSTSIRKRYQRYVPKSLPDDDPEMSAFQAMLFKVLCALSVDQVGIILKAAYEARVIVSNSYRKVCNTIAPYISTVKRKDISPDGLRSSAAKPEDRDKEIAVESLLKVVAKIREC